MKRSMWVCVAVVLALLAGCSQPLGAPAGLGEPDPSLAPEGLAMGMGAVDTSSRGTLSPEAVEARALGYVAGIDVSYYQGAIDWKAVYAAGKRFAFARVSYGTNTVDSRFAANWPAMKAAGIIRGAYQFFRPSQDAAAQANLFLSKLGKLEAGDLPAVIDVEVTEGVAGSVIVSKVRTWVNIVKAATGKMPIIYTSPGFWNSLPGTSVLSDCTLWVAHWGVSSPSLPSAWSSWKFWQYSDSGSVSGISGAVDLDWFNGDLTALKLFASTKVAVYEAPFTRSLRLASPIMTGRDVTLLQTLLNDWAKATGRAPIAADGVFGNGTASMVKAFQGAKGLVSDGIAGPATQAELVRVFTSLATYYTPYTRTLRRTSPTMYGNDVKAFQTAYNVWARLKGQPTLVVDGYFGLASENAALRFQGAETRLLGAPDGIAGKMTQRLLFVRSWK
ncbi:MAG: peptidoglycan-binding protein [Spirochaetia bacterium]|nr:peptidoglycan-binding protein [Spirochaetia bacterium]